MALQLSLATFSRLPAMARSMCSRACESVPRAPCAPCAPAPRPTCRARPETSARAVRRVCCPPPAGHPPPCASPPCPTPLSCSDRPMASKRIVPAESINCGADRDAVAVRLALAERARRLEYEREARAWARVKRAARLPPREPFALGGERQCARATDGRDYTLPCARHVPSPCGPGRVPPPDRCVEIARDDGCAIRDGDRVDPCAHLPRTLVEIDRSASVPTHVPQDASPPPRNFTSQILESLSLSHTRVATSSCPRLSGGPKCDSPGAKKAGDSDWCKTLSPPAPVSPACRKQTPMDKMKRRGPGRCSETTGPSCKRSFHSCPTVSSTGVSKDINLKKESPQQSPSRGSSITDSDVEMLNKVLKAREELLEAGRGRVVTGKKIMQATAHGSLNIPVPTGTESVHVQVSLAGAGVRREPQTPCFKKSHRLEKQEPWLSMKSLHKKITSCRKLETTKVSTEPKINKPSTSHPQPSPCSPCAPSPCKPAKLPTHPLPTVPPPSPPKYPKYSPCTPSQPKNKPMSFSIPSNTKAQSFLVK